MKSDFVSLAAPRTDIHATLPNGSVMAAPHGTTLHTLFQAAVAHGWLPAHPPIAAAVVDGRLRELSYAPTRDANVTPVTIVEPDGARIYRRSLVLLLVVAVYELYPDLIVDVSYAIPDGGYFCKFPGCPPPDEAMLNKIEQHMQAIVAADAPITRSIVPLSEALHLFEQRGDHDKLRLLESRDRDTLALYELRGYRDYYYGYMLPSTGYLRRFRLLPTDGGFILQYPHQDTPDTLTPLVGQSKMNAVFQEAHEALDRLGVADVGRLNQIIRSQGIQEVILIAEALQEQHISNIAQEIARRIKHGVKLITIAGPSSSGKTTFSKRLAIQLMALGVQPLTIELDNFFVDREHTPRDANGDYDFEALEAINLSLLNDVMHRLLNGEEVQLPKFNFLTGKSGLGAVVRLLPNQIIVTEGIHGLNPRLFASLPHSSIHHLYVSMLTQLNLDRHNRVSTSDVRLLRRIVRDARTRGYTASDTISRWQSVRRGEKRNIFPHQENADALFDSGLTYELAALRPFAEPLLLQVAFGTPQHVEANRLLSFLRWVEPLNADQLAMIPDTSLLREFIGGSVLERYHPGTLGTS
ncbi:nucleoside kinase [Fischerella thermalis CCMEE 5330]|uniref:Nucleoside kinase n=1 Tax=Fischerella thermalis CCMEE 5330 TaxID=2019670 RepID=A0A2N6MNJ0_9CYAN|nr:nucleoside kinase [Fischerella thermalis CCMEE 5330]